MLWVVLVLAACTQPTPTRELDQLTSVQQSVNVNHEWCADTCKEGHDFAECICIKKAGTDGSHQSDWIECKNAACCDSPKVTCTRGRDVVRPNHQPVGALPSTRAGVPQGADFCTRNEDYFNYLCEICGSTVPGTCLDADPHCQYLDDIGCWMDPGQSSCTYTSPDGVASSASFTVPTNTCARNNETGALSLAAFWSFIAHADTCSLGWQHPWDHNGSSRGISEFCASNEYCGNGVCEAQIGEDSSSCLRDCPTNSCPSGNYDCAGTCDGPARPDACGVCGGDGSSCQPPACNWIDCQGTCNGNVWPDVCGVCGGDGSSCQPPACNWTDCQGTCNGNVWPDACGVCGGDGSSCQPPACSWYDCQGTCDGGVWNDACGVCGGDGSSCRPPACSWYDCQGTCNGGVWNDSCGVCGGDGSSCACSYYDCFGVCNGSYSYDNCGVCGGDNSSCAF
jgi:hypothetical protein